MSDDSTTGSTTKKTHDSSQEPVAPAPAVTTDTDESHVSSLTHDTVVETSSDTSGTNGSKRPDSPTTSSIKTDSKEGNATDSLQSNTKQTLPPAADTGKLNELRLEHRLHVRWHADALIDGHDIYHGFIKNISMKGTDIFLELNLQKVKSIKLRIHLPPASKTSGHHFMEVIGNVIYTAYDGEESLFHTGISFTHFNLKSDQAYLQSRIAAFNHAG